MSLSTALDLSRSSLATLSELTEITSRNVANASNGSSRKIANLVTDAGGGARLASIGRAAVEALRGGVTSATSDAERLSAISAAFDKLDLTGGSGDVSSTPSGRIGDLVAALQVFSSNAADQSSARAVVDAANDVTVGLHAWAKGVSEVRASADTDIRAAIGGINAQLAQYKVLDSQIVNGTIAGRDVTDQLDARDSLINSIAEQIGLTVVNRSNNSVALYTDSGITLFDGNVRNLSIATQAMTDGMPGATVVIDGVPALGKGATMPVSSGRLAGLIEVRDVLAPTLGAQLDDIAAGLIRAFAEADQSATVTLPTAAGLFAAAGNSSVPTAGSSNPGLAKSIIVNPNADPSKGGDLTRLRDGGIADPSQPGYVYNSQGTSGFNHRIQMLVASLSVTEVHDPAGGLTAPASTAAYAAASVGWLNGQRQTVSGNASQSAAVLQRAKDALSRDNGVNIDDEMTTLLSLERSYQASSKLITTVDSMFSALMEAIR